MTDNGLIKNFLQIQLKFLAEEMQAISKGLEKVVQELSMSENDGAVSENFRKVSHDYIILISVYRQILSLPLSEPLYPLNQK